MKITRFIPAAFNPDQEIELVDQESQEIKIASVETPKASLPLFS